MGRKGREKRFGKDHKTRRMIEIQWADYLRREFNEHAAIEYAYRRLGAGHSKKYKSPSPFLIDVSPHF